MFATAVDKFLFKGLRTEVGLVSFVFRISNSSFGASSIFVYFIEVLKPFGDIIWYMLREGFEVLRKERW
jgi:hypothetical protein